MEESKKLWMKLSRVKATRTKPTICIMVYNPEKRKQGSYATVAVTFSNPSFAIRSSQKRKEPRVGEMICHQLREIEVCLLEHFLRFKSRCFPAGNLEPDTRGRLSRRKLINNNDFSSKNT